MKCGILQKWILLLISFLLQTCKRIVELYKALDRCDTCQFLLHLFIYFCIFTILIKSPLHSFFQPCRHLSHRLYMMVIDGTPSISIRLTSFPTTFIMACSREAVRRHHITLVFSRFMTSTLAPCSHETHYYYTKSVFPHRKTLFNHSRNLTPLSLSGFSTCAVMDVPIGFPGSSCHAR